jgi:putative ABC transport system permease protein
LRSLGFSSRDLRTTVRSQAATLVTIAMLFGVPLGILTGGLAWRRFAERLGLVPSIDLPYAWLALVILAIVLIAMVGTLPPARAAARISPTEVLRERGQSQLNSRHALRRGAVSGRGPSAHFDR